jgi:CDP-diacylglycerol--serine O-phosphatidyltransferase
MRLKNKRSYILILPSLFTTGNLFCGFYSIIQSINHNFEMAAIAIIFAGLFDLLDGRVARITKSQSNFGMEYDSICDVVSFGLAPAILAYIWGLYTFGRLGLAGAFFFAACGALRLARFNSINHLELPKSYFIGLPIPAAANLVAAAIIAQQELNIWYPESILLVLMFALGFLMVSTIRYRSFKDFDLRHKRSFFQLVLIVALIALIAIKPEITVAIVISYYVLWGPIREIFRVLKTKTEHKKENLHEINPPQ